MQTMYKTMLSPNINADNTPKQEKYCDSLSPSEKQFKYSLNISAHYYKWSLNE